MRNHLRKIFFLLLGGGFVLAAATSIRPEPAELPVEESLFAEIDKDGNVLRVIVVSEEVINSGLFGDPANWVRTYADGRHRGKYTGKGDVYDRDLDIFATSTEAIEALKRPQL